ncbi:hypothetical protein GW17_00047129 [Ensete ventricosum]|nr:hypothetical protein GW17_00047129 [Ensete ventricosum]
MVGACGRRQRPWPGRRWRLPAARPEGVAPWPGLLLARAVAGRTDRQQGQRPRKATPPAHEVPLTRCRPRGAARGLPKGRLPTLMVCSTAACAGAPAVAAQRGARRGLGHPFEKRMILPL